MIISQATLQTLFTGFETKWAQAYMAAPAWYSKVAYEQPSATELQTYAFMSRIPTMRQWLGERQAQNAAAYVLSVLNNDYELTEKIDRNKIEDDQYGVFAGPILQMMGLQAKKQPDYMIRDLMRVGQSTLIYDNQNFFDPAHPIDFRNPSLGTQQNYWSTGKALTFDNYASVRAAMMGFLGEDNKPLQIVPNLLVVPPQLEGIARQILNSDYVGPATLASTTQAGGNTNIWKGSADLLIVPELALDPTTWYLFDTTKPIKPFVYQIRKQPEFTYLNNPTDIPVFQRREFQFGIHLRAAVAPTLWFLGAKAVA